eukprot:4718896-Pleurochrysis_carterae.AAC.2
MKERRKETWKHRERHRAQAYASQRLLSAVVVCPWTNRTITEIGYGPSCDPRRLRTVPSLLQKAGLA